MSLENEWTEWHLTPRGSEAGSTKRSHFGPDAEVERRPPSDRVLTWLMDHGWSVQFCPTHTETVDDDTIYFAYLFDRHGPDFDCAELKSLVTKDGWDMSDLVAPEARAARSASSSTARSKPPRGRGRR